MKVQLTLVGTAPLLMSNQRAADPLDPMVKEYKAIYAKRKKTDEDHQQLSDLEFLMRIYHDEEMGPYLPALNIKRCIQDGAKRTRQGQTVDEGLQTVVRKFPLIYKGTRDLKELASDRRYRDTRLVGVEGRLTLRTRPIFEEWEITALFEYEPDCLSISDVKNFAEQAGRFKGLGDYRPEFGKFIVKDVVEFDSD